MNINKFESVINASKVLKESRIATRSKGISEELFDFNDIYKDTNSESYKKFDKEIAKIIKLIFSLEVPDEKNLRTKIKWRLEELLQSVEKIYDKYTDEDINESRSKKVTEGKRRYFALCEPSRNPNDDTPAVLDVCVASDDKEAIKKFGIPLREPFYVEEISREEYNLYK